MPKLDRPAFHIPPSETPRQVLQALASSMTLRDTLNVMEAIAKILPMLEQWDAAQRQQLLQEYSESLERQIAMLRGVLKEINTYLQANE